VVTNHKDGGNTFLWNSGNQLQDHMMAQPKIPWLTPPPPWEPQSQTPCCFTHTHTHTQKKNLIFTYFLKTYYQSFQVPTATVAPASQLHGPAMSLLRTVGLKKYEGVTSTVICSYQISSKSIQQFLSWYMQTDGRTGMITLTCIQCMHIVQRMHNNCTTGWKNGWWVLHFPCIM
jgi:hypothetical protein